jgi:hypothetical protein
MVWLVSGRALLGPGVETEPFPLLGSRHSFCYDAGRGTSPGSVRIALAGVAEPDRLSFRTLRREPSRALELPQAAHDSAVDPALLLRRAPATSLPMIGVTVRRLALRASCRRPSRKGVWPSVVTTATRPRPRRCGRCSRLGTRLQPGRHRAGSAGAAGGIVRATDLGRRLTAGPDGFRGLGPHQILEALSPGPGWSRSAARSFLAPRWTALAPAEGRPGPASLAELRVRSGSCSRARPGARTRPGWPSDRRSYRMR